MSGNGEVPTRPGRATTRIAELLRAAAPGARLGATTVERAGDVPSRPARAALHGA